MMLKGGLEGDCAALSTRTSLMRQGSPLLPLTVFAHAQVGRGGCARRDNSRGGKVSP